MLTSHVQKIARVLNILVLIALVCNLILLFFVPVAVRSDQSGLLLRTGDYLSGVLFPGEDDISAAGAAASWLSWFWIFSQEPNKVMLTLFLLFSGCCTAVILWQGRRVLRTILRGEPFSMENAVSLKRAALCSFIISGAALVRVTFNICLFRSAMPLLSYNALFVPIFAMDVMMAKRKMSLSQLSEKVDITLANLSILKNNKAKAVRFSTLEAICAALDCQPGDILEYVPDPDTAQ